MSKDNDELKSIGERLVGIRKKLNLLQKDFARELDISNASLSEIEAGNNKPRFELIYNLTLKFKVNIYYLLHGQGEMFMPTEMESLTAARKYGPDTEKWLKNFLNYFNESEMLRYAMMSYFSKYLTENRKSIELEILSSRGQKEGGLDWQA